jgi:hypothetical protein
MAGLYYWRVHHTRQNRIDRAAGPDVIQHDDPRHSFPNRFDLSRIAIELVADAVAPALGWVRNGGAAARHVA